MHGPRRGTASRLYTPVARVNPTRLQFEALLPPQALAANRKPDWHTLGEAKATYRREVCIAALNEANRVGWQAPARALVSLYWGIAREKSLDPRYRPIDPPNAVYAFKAGFDGLKDAGLIRDDSYKHLDLGRTQIDPTVGPWVRVTVEVIEA